MASIFKFLTVAAGATVLMAGAAPALAQEHCEALFARSRAMSDPLAKAYDMMRSKDMSQAATTLATLEPMLNALPAVEIKPEVCGGDHINAYTTYQNLELNLKRAAGISSGFDNSLPIVKQPDLNQSALAYAVGWIKYEQGDFTGAKAAYAKGLAMFPHSHDLQNEYLAVMLQLNDAQGVVNYADQLLSDTHDYDDATRAKIYAARGAGEMVLGNDDEADSTFSVSLQYNFDQDTEDMQKAVEARMSQ